MGLETGPSRLGTRNPERTSIGVPGADASERGPGSRWWGGDGPWFPGRTDEAAGWEAGGLSAGSCLCWLSGGGPLLGSKGPPGRVPGDRRRGTSTRRPQGDSPALPLLLGPRGLSQHPQRKSRTACPPVAPLSPLPASASSCGARSRKEDSPFPSFGQMLAAGKAKADAWPRAASEKDEDSLVPAAPGQRWVAMGSDAADRVPCPLPRSLRPSALSSLSGLDADRPSRRPQPCVKGRRRGESRAGTQGLVPRGLHHGALWPGCLLQLVFLFSCFLLL